METKEIFFIIGQVLGFVAVALAILSYQMKTQRRLLLLKLGNAVVNAVHYLFIGAISGMALNLVSPVKYLVYLRRNTKGSNDKVIPILFTLITAAVGIITWTEWYSVFVFSGMVIHAFCMSFSDPQKVRISLLITSPLVIVYNVFVLSISGVVYESVAIASALIGIIRYRKARRQVPTGEGLQAVPEGETPQ
jgi:hypothetical protein